MNSLRKSVMGEKQPRSIRNSIAIALFVLIAIMLVIMWFAQTFLLPIVYRSVKMDETEKIITELSDEISKGDLDENEFYEYANARAFKYETCVLVLSVDRNYHKVLKDDICPYSDCFIHTIRFPYGNSYFSSWYTKAMRNGGTYTDILERDDYRDSSNLMQEEASWRKDQHVISVKVVKSPDGEKFMIVADSSLDPVNTTAKALNIQLVAVSVLMLCIATVIAIWSSKRISSPITEMSASAKELATGNYDVTFKESGSIETIELAKTLNMTTQELSRLDTMQKELIANISHDLRTPLTIISGYSEFMRDCPSEISSENLQVIIDETSRLSSLVNDLLNVSKLQSGAVPINLAKLNITDVVRKTIDRYDQLTTHDGYKITFEADADVYVQADEIRILQVVYNLINNAINYTGEDKCIMVRQDIIGNSVRISVIDTGEGISEENIPFIWDRYYKIDKVHTRAKIGTGLGLSIVKNILILHDSRFGVSSEIGKGSTFWFELDIVDGDIPLLSKDDNTLTESSDSADGEDQESVPNFFDEKE